MSKTDQILDLDALVPPKAIVKFNGKEIEVNPPKTGDLLRLGSLGSKMEKLTDLPEAEVDTLVTELTNLVFRIIPELKDETLSTPQLLALITLIGNMATPPETKELEAKGITPAGGNTDPKE